MALAVSEYEALQLESSTTRGMIVFAQATPATPVPLFVAAAAAPATAVPCPPLQPVSAVFELPVRKFQPAMSLGPKSGCVESAPESITAIGMFAEPRVTPQALGAWIVARCHWEEKSGSLGVTEPAGCARKSRSTNVNRPERCSTWAMASSAGSGTDST